MIIFTGVQPASPTGMPSSWLLYSLHNNYYLSSGEGQVVEFRGKRLCSGNEVHRVKALSTPQPQLSARLPEQLHTHVIIQQALFPASVPRGTKGGGTLVPAAPCHAPAAMHHPSPSSCVFQEQRNDAPSSHAFSVSMKSERSLLHLLSSARVLSWFHN